MKWYAIIPSEILSSKELSSSAKLLVGVLVSLSNKTGYCFASNQYISEVLGVSLVYVRALIKELEDKKIIEREISSKVNKELGHRTIKILDLKLLKQDSDKKKEPMGVLPEYQGGATIVSGGVIPEYHHNIRDNNKENNKEKILTEKILKDDRFDEFWELYGKKVGKEKAKAKWSRLKDKEKEACLLAIPNYKIARPDPTYRKDPERYLSHRVWEDELPTNQTIQQTNNQQNTNNSSFEINIPDQW